HLKAQRTVPLTYLLFQRHHPPTPTLFPYTTLFRSRSSPRPADRTRVTTSRPFLLTSVTAGSRARWWFSSAISRAGGVPAAAQARSEEHTSELQSRGQLVCRLLLEKTNL